jgi:prepilin-type processing-associated H-X9-DG protein
MGFITPMTYTARTSARRAQSTNNLKQIGLGLLTYESARGTYPPAYTADKNGKPLLSWRVLILPYVEGDGLYKEFHLDEPWDSPHNKKLISRMPSVYRNPNSTVGGQWKTNYLTVRGKDTIFSGAKGTKIADVTDGTSNTIMTVEVPDDKAVIWTKPDDFEYDEELPMKGLLGGQPGGFNVGFADGSVRLIPASIKPETLKSLFTRNDGEAIDHNELDR